MKQQLTFGKTIKTIHFSRKSDLVALGGDDGTIYIICSQHWTVEKEIKMASSAITALRFSRRDERLAVGSSDGIVALMEPSNDWKIVGEIETSDVGISCIDWSSRHLAVARFDGTISVYEGSRVLANFFLPEAELARGGGPVHAITFGVGGQFLGASYVSAVLARYLLYRLFAHQFLVHGRSCRRRQWQGRNLQCKGRLGLMSSAEYS